MATLVEAMSELKLTPETSESLMVEFKVTGWHTWTWLGQADWILVEMVRNSSTFNDISVDISGWGNKSQGTYFKTKEDRGP